MTFFKSRRLQIALLMVLLCAFASAPFDVATDSHAHPQTGLTLAAKPIVRIPADVTDRGLVFLRARVNQSKPLWFVLDSGASFPFVVDTRRADALGLKLFDMVKGSGAGAVEFDIGSTSGLTVNLGGLNFNNANAAVISLSSIETQAGRSIEGLVGSQLFIKLVVEIDYLNEHVTLYNPATYTYSGTGESIPLAMEGDYLFVPAKIEPADRSAFEGRFLVDTGGGWVTAVLTTPFAKARNFPARQDKVVVDRSLAGLGGEIELLLSRAKTLRIGKLVMPNPVIYSSRDDAGALASTEFDGVIGSEVLRRFKVIFDYPRRRLILEPNARFADPFEAEMSGIRLRASGERFRTYQVFQLIDNSPATQAGLRIGDVLIDIDDRSAARYSMDEIYEMFKQAGREYKLKLRRGRRRFEVKLRMRRLI